MSLPAIARTLDRDCAHDLDGAVQKRSAIAKTLRGTSRGKLIGFHPELRGIVDTIERVARSNCTVLVTGESGTGKELIVAALHDASPRKDRCLLTINCGAIPEGLIESELFGHAKGAFTGATASRQGVIAASEGGTLFLDEVGELSPNVQVKLLRVLQQREYTPVGETRAIKCDVRIVAATNRDLSAEVKARRFREDLYYRLNVIHVRLPALRERGDDLRLLAIHFFEQACARVGRDDLRGISERALDAIASHDWPGNVRELENAIERGVLLARGPNVEPGDILPGAVPAIPRDSHVVEVAPKPLETSTKSTEATAHALPDDGLDLRAVLEEYETSLVREALARTGWNKNRAAQLLGLNRTTLVEMIKRKQLSA